jgi:hypothetical protein
MNKYNFATYGLKKRKKNIKTRKEKKGVLCNDESYPLGPTC